MIIRLQQKREDLPRRNGGGKGRERECCGIFLRREYTSQKNAATPSGREIREPTGQGGVSLLKRLNWAFFIGL
jgi:hypothetical protein